MARGPPPAAGAERKTVTAEDGQGGGGTAMPGGREPIPVPTHLLRGEPSPLPHTGNTTHSRTSRHREPSPLPHLERRRAELEVETAAAARAGDSASQEEYRQRLEEVDALQRDVQAWCHEQPPPASVPSLRKLSASQQRLVSEMAEAVRCGSPLPTRRHEGGSPLPTRQHEGGSPMPTRRVEREMPEGSRPALESEHHREEGEGGHSLSGVLDDDKEMVAAEAYEMRCGTSEHSVGSTLYEEIEGVLKDAVDAPTKTANVMKECVKFVAQEAEDMYEHQTTERGSDPPGHMPECSYEQSTSSSSMQITRHTEAAYSEATSHGAMSSQDFQMSSENAESWTRAVSGGAPLLRGSAQAPQDRVDGSALSMPDTGILERDPALSTATGTLQMQTQAEHPAESEHQLQASRSEEPATEHSRESRRTGGAGSWELTGDDEAVQRTPDTGNTSHTTVTLDDSDFDDYLRVTTGHRVRWALV